MDRRRSLLAASQTGGGKIVNTITLTCTATSVSIYYRFNVQALYPVNSEIIIKGSSGNATRLVKGGISHTGYFQHDETFEIGFSDDGLFAQEIEDDTYIYKLVLEN